MFSIRVNTGLMILINFSLFFHTGIFGGALRGICAFQARPARIPGLSPLELARYRG
jgi:hypothetical protein